MEFAATEAGFRDGVGGASNAAGEGPAHYVLFGLQTDTQHPANSGVYFEYDDQINGSVGRVERVSVTPERVEFTLRRGPTIAVTRQVEPGAWSEFLSGIAAVFPAETVAVG